MSNVEKPVILSAQANTGGENSQLTRVLKPIHLWALAVGLVISGNYFGWSYGFGAGGVIGLAIALIPVTIFYVTFILSYSELATSIPHAGGPSAYARRALGKFWGYMSGISCLIEFVFAPPAIALAIGGYIHNIVPAIPAMTATVFAFLVFIFINYWGMKTSATFELIVTIVALVGLVIYWGLAIPHFDMAKVMAEPVLPNGYNGIMAAVPFAIWFYLAIEGGAMSAEEMVNPQKDISVGFLSGMGTLTVMAFATLFLTAGIADVALIDAVDYPLPMALSCVYGESSFWVLAINAIGLFGLVASLHGIILGYSRQAYAMARTGYLPKFLAYVHPKHRTPVWALLLPGLVCLGAAMTGLTNVVITISVFGSVIMYIISLISLFVLRSKEPEMKRPFKVPMFPLVPTISLIIAVFCVVSLLVASIDSLIWVAVAYVLAVAYYFIWGNKNIRPFEEEFGVLDELDN
ncbi:ethanolamine permease [Sporomusa acidovorans]|uniref:Amino acid permease YhdG n=1 Tax=Sporomusa acidovorans (strain ATCC 49682 / DSM 3132 / Mol) TaxID=1123286 RepID=A0ABZ3J889_SPOA4|nr:ethanolamine permease [Sporomusa acidovorans]OZC17519.1 putative amino acid permease YhdG [Sporomusa acidovorans DSM 3132]SDF08228.1 ethanolamine:proton symporter, EAT family [Sporomusa acidovorans]